MLTLSAPILALAVLWLDLAFGPVRFALRGVPAPPVLLGRIARSLSQRLDRPNRSVGTLRARGAVLGLLLCGGSALIGLGIEAVLGRLPTSLAFPIKALIFWGFLRAHLPLARLREGSRRAGGEPGRAAAVSGLLEQTAVSFVHFVVGPLFWFLVAGLPGAFTAAAAWAIDRAARENGTRRPFAAFASGFEFLLSWIPARIAEILLAVAATIVPRGRPILALTQGWKNAPLGQYGAVAALAGGLGVALPGPPNNGTEERKWLGGGTAKVGRNDLLRATWLYVVVLLIVTGLLILLAIAELGGPIV